tara:strand:- start:45446 stop:45838 length:393 start_codon:yes stop_codon:yes gene_type:complete
MRFLLSIFILVFSYNTFSQDFSSYEKVKEYFDSLKVENEYFNGDFAKTNNIFLIEKELNYNIAIQDRYTSSKEIFFQVYKLLNQEFIEGYCTDKMFDKLKDQDIYLKINMYNEKGNENIYKFIVSEEYCS